LGQVLATHLIRLPHHSLLAQLTLQVQAKPGCTPEAPYQET